jgi:hypothetical protein
MVCPSVRRTDISDKKKPLAGNQRLKRKLLMMIGNEIKRSILYYEIIVLVNSEKQRTKR